MGRPGAEGPPYFEGRVTDYLVAFFRGLGVRFDRIEVAPGRDNLLAYYEAPGGAGRRTLLWDAHQDTVPAEGMTIEPFRPVVAEGRVTGRGSCDVKAGLAAMLAAFARLVRERPEGSANVILACTVDEEYTHTGSSALARMNLGADLAIVAEPTMLRVVNAHKGAVRWKVIARGVACHSSTPGLGVNAIYRMARVVGAIEDHARSLARGPGRPGPRPADASRSAGSRAARASTSCPTTPPSSSTAG